LPLATDQDEREEALILAASTLEERRRYGIPARVPGFRRNAQAVSTRLDLWRKHFVQVDCPENAWRSFLSHENLSQRELCRLECLIGIKHKSFKWVRTLRAIMRDLEKRNSTPRYKEQLAESLATPVVQYAWSCLLKSRGIFLSAEISRPVQAALQNCLCTRLADTIRQVANWEFHIFRATPGLFEESMPEEKQSGSIEHFVFPGVETELLRLFRSYPALARLWSVQVISWTRFVTEFLERSRLFLKQTAGEPSSTIAAIEPDRSDLHEGNRSVVRMLISKGEEWFYKPRSGEAEQAWYELLRWLNAEGFPAPFKVLRIVPGHKHFWMEGVAPRSCATFGDAALYYFRAGAMLFLAHLLRGVDFHAGNIIAHGPHPVIVDCETLLHPVGHRSNMLRPEERSVLRSGMLPVTARYADGAEDVSALGCRSPGPHSVRLRGRVLGVDQFAEDVVTGFERMHAFLCSTRKRHRIFAGKVNELQNLRCRHIHRPTRHYHAILTHSLTHRALTCGLERSILLSAACCHRAVATRCLSNEVRALEMTDIPIFHGRPSRYVASDLCKGIATIRDSISIIRQACAQASR
jgi:lantibiotic modifying enzyme